MDLPLTVGRFFAVSTRRRLSSPSGISAEHHTAFQVFYGYGESAAAILDVLSHLALKERIGGRGLQERQFDNIGIIRAYASDDFTVTADFLGDTVTVRVDCDERVVCKTGNDMVTESDSNLFRVISFYCTPLSVLRYIEYTRLPLRAAK